MSDRASIEQGILHALKAPDRYEIEFDPSAIVTELYRQSLIDSYEIARQAWTEALPMAVSYRECFVVAGASLLASDTNRLYRVFGYNFKPEPGDTANIHAEELVLYQAQSLEATTLSLVVVGDPQPDNSITAHDLVLSPCDYRCTPKIVADASVGSFTTAVCVNPRTGATQFIPHSRLAPRDWQDIPCIEVSGLNDKAEWLEKALPIIDMLVQQTDIAELEAFVAERERRHAVKMAQLLFQITQSRTNFVFSDTSAFASTQSEFAVTTDFQMPEQNHPFIIMGKANLLNPGVAVPEF